MIRLSRETETLIMQLAQARGISPEKAVAEAFAHASRQAERVENGAHALAKDELIRRMEEISARCAARPLVDPQSPDELLGYDDFGLPG